MTDMNPVTLPSHYQFSDVMREVRDVIRDRTVVYLDNGLPAEGIYDYDNAIKYILRAPAKNGIEDLRKAKYCLDSLIDLLEADAYRPAEHGYGVFAIDVEADFYEDDDEVEWELSSLFDPDVLADVITRISESIKDKQQEMVYHVMTTGMLPPTPCDRLTGLRSPAFDE